MLFAREGAKVLCADLNFEAASATAQAINDAAGEKLAIAVGVNVANAGTTNRRPTTKTTHHRGIFLRTTRSRKY
jgi:NAD(P)-dependent dehydrogenase (short-subunit alcohol dehydrogenase family)